MKTVGQLIRERRVAMGISQAELALRIGLGISSVSNWETGRVDPQMSNLFAVAKVLSCEPCQLVPATEPPSPNVRAIVIDGVRHEWPEDLRFLGRFRTPGGEIEFRFAKVPASAKGGAQC